MSGVARARRSLACKECSRRKVSCSKEVPCRRCIDSGLGAQCQRGPSSRQKTSEVRAHRVSRATSSTPTSPTHIVNQGDNGQVNITHGVSHESAAPDEEREATDAATILEYISWGKRKEIDFTTQLAPPPAAQSYEDVYDSTSPSHDETHLLAVLQLTLPSRSKVYQLVEYHSECILWFHNSFHASTFRRELDDFYDIRRGSLTAPGIDLQWAALLFSILVGSIACADEARMQRWGIRSLEQTMLSREWLRGITACLNAGQYMAHPSLTSCMAIATMTMSAHILGESNQQSVLLAAAVRIGQSLGLHRLNASKPKTLEREIGRRVWAQLCQQDWFSIPFAECYLINPMYSETLPPLNCDDVTMLELDPSFPTITSYGRYLQLIATLMPVLQDAVVTANTPFTRYKEVLRIDREMRRIALHERPAVLSRVPIRNEWPCWTQWARRAATLSSSHKIIMIHRKFLTLSFTNTAFAFTRQTCIAASKTILHEVVQPIADAPTLWVEHAFTVAASITLCLDILHRSTSDTERRDHRALVESAVSYLKDAKRSTIATRGIPVIAHLLALDNANEGGRTAGKRRGDQMTASDAPKRRAINISDIVRQVNRSTSQSASPQVAQSQPSRQPHAVAEPSHEGYDHWYAASSIETPDIYGDLNLEQGLIDFRDGLWMTDANAFADLLSMAQH